VLVYPRVICLSLSLSLSLFFSLFLSLSFSLLSLYLFVRVQVSLPNRSGAPASLLSVLRGQEVIRVEDEVAVVLVFEAPLDFGFSVYPGAHVQMGATLGACQRNLPTTPRQARRQRKTEELQKDTVITALPTAAAGR
jgi:hypothetical protein